MTHAQAAVDRDDGAGDVGGVGGGEEGDDAGDLLGRGHAAQRHGGGELGQAGLAEAAVMSVATGPGATTLQVMLREPSSRATERAKPTRPAFEAA